MEWNGLQTLGDGPAAYADTFVKEKVPVNGSA